MATHIEHEPFSGIIQEALTKRGTAQRDHALHPELRTPLYVVRMCESLVRAIQEAGNQAVTLAEVVRLESACTGADYHHKLAMRCHRLSVAIAA
jgi:hypothetical protein